MGHTTWNCRRRSHHHQDIIEKITKKYTKKEIQLLKMKTSSIITIALLSLYGEGLPLNSTNMDINRSFTEKHVRMAKSHNTVTFDYVGKQYSVSFDFVPSKLKTSWGSVFHMGDGTGDCCKKGQRLPGIWFRREKGVSWIYVSSDISGNGDHV